MCSWVNSTSDTEKVAPGALSMTVRRDAVDGDRALHDDVAQDLRRRLEARDDRLALRRERLDGAGGLDDAADEVPAEAPGQGQGALQVDRVADLEVAEVGAPVGLVDDVGVEAVLIEVDAR